MRQTQILALTPREDFVGRDAELRALTQQAVAATARGIILMSAPGAGAGELLRQTYDQLFQQRGFAIPVYFPWKANESASETGRRFFKTALQQYIAYRRVDSLLCTAPLTLNDLSDLALPSDYELVTTLIDRFEREQTSENEFLEFCFSMPHRLSVNGRVVYPLLDCMATQPFGPGATIAGSLLRLIRRTRGPFAIAGLRRQVAQLLHDADRTISDASGTVNIDRLDDEAASRLIDTLARRRNIKIDEASRDLIAQQLGGSPLFISTFLRTAHDKQTSLVSFLNCQRLYVDDLMGGSIKRHFDSIINGLADSSQTKRTLLRVLYESAASETRKSSLGAWKKRIGLASHEFEQLIEALHVYEMVNSTAAFIEVNTDSYPWIDYLRTQYELEVSGGPRARVVGAMLAETLKRAPQTMAQKYRRESALGLADLLPQFNCQDIPAVLFHYDRFAARYKGETPDAIESGLETESELLRLPQVIQAVCCGAITNTAGSVSERCVVAHAFENAEYETESEVVWLVTEIDSKLEASRELIEASCDRLTSLARENGFERFRIWLITREGFSKDASDFLNERKAFGSSRQQFELIAKLVSTETLEPSTIDADEYEMIIPMGEDSELVAARAVEQIARRINFQPEAINQIKTALVEACINATEHSLSPDRRIYQRFRLEDDKLVVTVASRGVVPTQLPGRNGQEASIEPNAKSRRGWGLKLIKTLMDEVEFVHVDDGTQLRMTKYLR